MRIFAFVAMGILMNNRDLFDDISKLQVSVRMKRENKSNSDHCSKAKTTLYNSYPASDDGIETGIDEPNWKQPRSYPWSHIYTFPASCILTRAGHRPNSPSELFGRHHLSYLCSGFANCLACRWDNKWIKQSAVNPLSSSYAALICFTSTLKSNVRLNQAVYWGWYNTCRYQSFGVKQHSLSATFFYKQRNLQQTILCTWLQWKHTMSIALINIALGSKWPLTVLW